MDNILNFLYNAIDIFILSVAYLLFSMWKNRPQDVSISYGKGIVEIFKHSLSKYTTSQKALLTTVLFITPSVIQSYSLDLQKFRDSISIMLFIYLIYENSDLLSSGKHNIIKNILGFDRLLIVLAVVFAIQNIFLMDEIGCSLTLKALVLILLSLVLILRLSLCNKEVCRSIKLENGLWGYAFVQYANIYLLKYLAIIQVGFIPHILIYFLIQCLQLIILFKVVSVVKKIRFRSNFLNNGNVKVYIIVAQILITMRILI